METRDSDSIAEAIDRNGSEVASAIRDLADAIRESFTSNNAPGSGGLPTNLTQTTGELAYQARDILGVLQGAHDTAREALRLDE